MAENILILSELFALRTEPPPGPAEQRWQDRLGAQLNDELKGIKWPTALPDLAQKLGELLDLPLPPLFLDSWKKMEALQTAMKATNGRPQESRSVVLDQHVIETVFEPSIEIRLWKVMPLPKKLVFPVKLKATFRTLDLQVRNGAITRISGGECDVAGTLSLSDTVIAHKQFGTLRLGGALLEIDDRPGSKP